MIGGAFTKRISFLVRVGNGLVQSHRIPALAVFWLRPRGVAVVVLLKHKASPDAHPSTADAPSDAAPLAVHHLVDAMALVPTPSVVGRALNATDLFVGVDATERAKTHVGHEPSCGS